MKNIIRYLISSFLILILTTLTLFSWVDKQIYEFEESKTKFIAHRGLSSEYYENTEQAFIGAGESDFFFGIETDIRLTSDGVWVCAHDVNPFEDENILISDVTYEEAMIIPLKMNISADIELNDEYYLSDFETYLDICIQYEKVAFIEVKDTPTPDEMNSLITLIESKISRDNYKIISFNKDNIDKVNSINSDISTQLLSSYFVSGAYNYIRDYNLGIKEHTLAKYLIFLSQKRGLEVNVWTINDKDLAIKYMGYRVDFITTDYILEVY